MSIQSMLRCSTCALTLYFTKKNPKHPNSGESRCEIGDVPLNRVGMCMVTFLLNIMLCTSKANSFIYLFIYFLKTFWGTKRKKNQIDRHEGHVAKQSICGMYGYSPHCTSYTTPLKDPCRLPTWIHDWIKMMILQWET